MRAAHFNHWSLEHPFYDVQVQDSVEEVENSGFLATASTLDVKLMANNKILQVRVV